MDIPLKHDWKNILHKELESLHFQNLYKQLNFEYQNGNCFPKKELLFNALNLCDFANIKVVIIGQDPYHGIGEANGLAFSVNDGVKIPPSLKNIYTEINLEYQQVFMPSSGNLEKWAKQGVLLLNNTLSVAENKPNSHHYLQWNIFTDNIIKNISNQHQNLVFMLWGNFAQKKITLIDAKKHLVLQSGHPSPLSANRGFWFGNNHFVLANNYLEENNKTIIDWII